MLHLGPESPDVSGFIPPRMGPWPEGRTGKTELRVNSSPEVTSGPGLPHRCCAWQAAPAPQLGRPNPEPARHVSNRPSTSPTEWSPSRRLLLRLLRGLRVRPWVGLRWAESISSSQSLAQPRLSSPPSRDKQRRHRSCQVTGNRDCLFQISLRETGKQCPSNWLPPGCTGGGPLPSQGLCKGQE